jgi:hypothetical protein
MPADNPRFGIHAAPPESSQGEMLLPADFLYRVYEAYLDELNINGSTSAIATFEQQEVEEWEYHPNTREAGLGPGSMGSIELQQGVIAEVDDLYIGMAIGKVRGMGRTLQRFQFGVQPVATFKRHDELHRRITEWQNQRTQGVEKIVIPSHPEPKPQDVLDLRNIVSLKSGRYSLRMQQDDFSGIDVRSYRDGSVPEVRSLDTELRGDQGGIPASSIHKTIQVIERLTLAAARS